MKLKIKMATKGILSPLYFLCTLSFSPTIFHRVSSEPVPLEYKIEQTKISSQIIDQHFHDCYVLKSRTQASTTVFTNTVTQIPAIELNFDKHDHKRVLTHFVEASRHSLTIKHNRQCIVYYISLTGFNSTNMDNLLNIFLIQALQIEATYSYIIVSEFDSYDTAESFFMSQKLKNYQHRMYVNPDPISNSNENNNLSSQFKIQRFCLFCAAGNPSITIDSTNYKNTNEISDFTEIFPDMTRNFHGKTMRCTAPPAPPLVLIIPSRTHPGKNDIHGQHAKILKNMAHHFNFTYSLYTSPGGLTGIKLPNGTWNGIMGEILYDRADIGLSVATSYERYQIVDATTSVFYAFLVLVSTKPKPTFEWQAIFYPFRPNCWLAFIFSIAVSFLISKWLHNSAIKYEIPWTFRRQSNAEIIKKLQAEFLTAYKTFYITVGNLLEQGAPFTFNTTPSRMFITFWMFFAMIITTAYRSKLFTFLTFPTVEVPPSTFLELIRSTYKFGMKHLGGIAFVFITKSPLTYIRTVGEKMTVYNDKYTCLDRTFRDRFTCIIYKAYIDYMMEVRYWKVRHQFYISDFVTPPVGSSWVLPKNAPWLPAFDRVSYPTYEMGLADKYLYDYQVNIAKVLRAQAQASNSTKDIFDLNTNFRDEDGGPKPLVMANLYAAFFILLFGVVIAAALLMFENFRRNKFNKKLKQQQLRLRIHLRRKLRQKKRGLAKGQRLSFQQVVQIVGPNTSDILESENRHVMKNKLFHVTTKVKCTR